MFNRSLSLAVAILLTTGAAAFGDPEADAITSSLACEYMKGLATTAKNSTFDAQQRAAGNGDTAGTMYSIYSGPNGQAALTAIQNGDTLYNEAVLQQYYANGSYAEGYAKFQEAESDFFNESFLSAIEEFGEARDEYEFAKVDYDWAKPKFDEAYDAYDDAMAIMMSP
ncbi:MAG: hypothetical protein IAF94_08220 [Pirellulaceae bacterium]|nr:hypothetical protein [Pirellulaceae bacterium]